MAKKIATIVDLMKKHEVLDKGTQYYREVRVNGEWCHFNPERPTLLAYSKILGDKEMLVVVNCSDKEIENSITVDKFITPENSVLTDIAGGRKKETYLVENGDDRNFVTIKLAPHHVAVLKQK